LIAEVAPAQRVGIGTTSPYAGLHIKGSGHPESFIYLQANAAQDAGLRLYEGETVKWHIFNQASLGGFHIYNNAVQTALFLNQSNAFVGIGTITPQARLDVNGQIRMSGGNPGVGKVLTSSDAEGLASWVSLPPVVLDLPYIGIANTNIGFTIFNEKGIAIEGKVIQTDGAGTGVLGETASSGGRGVRGLATSTTGTTYGVFGESAASNGFGLKGLATSATGSTYGCWATSASSSGYGVIGDNTSLTGITYGVRGSVVSPDGYSGYFTGGKFFVQGSVGIGINTPSRNLTVRATTASSTANFVNDATGTTAGDGLMIGIASSLNANLMNYEIGALSLGTNGSNRLTIAADGDVGIGTIDPIYKLDVTGLVNLNKGLASGVAIRVNGDEALWYNGTYYSWGYDATFNFFKKPVGIDCQPGEGHLLAVNGVASKPGGGTWATFSDFRLKDVHGNYERGLNDILRLQPVLFNYKKDNALSLPSETEYAGFIAQDVQKAFPESVTQNKNGYLEFDMSGVNVAVINAIKELKAENEQLKARIAEIEKQLSLNKQ
jgi:hypothetical protein